MRRSAEHRDPARGDRAGAPAAVDLEGGEELRGLHVAPVRPRAADPRLTATVGIAAVLLCLVVLKPWGVAAPEPSSAPRPVAIASVAPTPVPTRDRTPDGLASPICLGTGGWRIASLETWRTQDVRVWRAIEPIANASGPLDATIPSVPIVAVVLPAFGWCAPSYGPDKPIGPATVTAWAVRDGVAAVLPLEQVQPSDGRTPLAALYLPAPGCLTIWRCAPASPRASPAGPVTSTGPAESNASSDAADPGAWSSGRVVFRYVDEGAETVAWFAADLQIAPAAPTPAPIP